MRVESGRSIGKFDLKRAVPAVLAVAAVGLSAPKPAEAVALPNDEVNALECTQNIVDIKNPDQGPAFKVITNTKSYITDEGDRAIYVEKEITYINGSKVQENRGYFLSPSYTLSDLMAYSVVKEGANLVSARGVIAVYPPEEQASIIFQDGQGVCKPTRLSTDVFMAPRMNYNVIDPGKDADATIKGIEGQLDYK